MRISDWSAGVCSSDLAGAQQGNPRVYRGRQGREECGKGAQGGRQRRAIITGKSREGGPEEGTSLATSTRVVARRHYARNYFKPSGSGSHRLRCNGLGCLRGRRSRGTARVRKRVVEGKGVAISEVFGGRTIIK